MTLEKIIKSGFINDRTDICVRKENSILTWGNWYHDDLLAHKDKELESFTWQDGNKVYVDLKEE